MNAAILSAHTTRQRGCASNFLKNHEQVQRDCNSTHLAQFSRVYFDDAGEVASRSTAAEDARPKSSRKRPSVEEATTNSFALSPERNAASELSNAGPSMWAQVLAPSRVKKSEPSFPPATILPFTGARSRICSSERLACLQVAPESCDRNRPCSPASTTVPSLVISRCGVPRDSKGKGREIDVL